MTRLMTIVAATALACAAGCGSQVTKKEAREGWSATSNALIGGQVAAATAGSGNVDFAYGCLGGGSAEFAGTYNGEEEDFSFTVGFDQCRSQGVTIDGDLEFLLDVETSETGASVTYSYVGHLEWSGDVNGSCDIDMQGNASASTTGASVSYDGSVCGHDASATLSSSF